MADKNVCRICARELNNPDDPTTRDCGGDCLRCMADCGDPDCQREMYALTGWPRYAPEETECQ